MPQSSFGTAQALLSAHTEVITPLVTMPKEKKPPRRYKQPILKAQSLRFTA